MMNLWFGSLFLVVGLFPSSSALTPEECQPLITSLSLADPTMMYGKTNFILGYTDDEVHKSILKSTESSWMKITPSFRPNEIIMDQGFKMNDTCLVSTLNITLDGDTATTSLPKVFSAFHVLPTCDGCLLLSINSTIKSLDHLLRSMNMSHTFKEQEIHARSLYLMGRETTVKDSDVEHFRRQASCLGFTREPDFHYDPKKGFCKEGEGILMTFQ